MPSVKKPFNFRLPFALALALACGIFCAYLLAYAGANFVFVFALVPVAAAVVIAAALFIRSDKHYVSVVLIVLLFAFGAIYCWVKLSLYASDSVVLDGLTEIRGRVEEVGRTASGIPYFILGDASAGGVSVGGKILVYLDEKAGGFADIGYTVKGLGTLEKYTAFAYGDFNYLAVDNVKYSCTFYGSMQSQYGFSLFGAIRSAMRNILYDNLDGETAAVAYGMLTGDTVGMDVQTVASFRYGGIAHVFAVSGLHIGVLFGALSFLVDRPVKNRKVAAVLKISLLLFYAGVCVFTPSSVRATVMCSVFALSRITFQKYDFLNSLSAAVLILLCINPLYLFDVGFILSVSAMLGIAFLQHNIGRVLSFLPQRIAASVSFSLSVQAATLPALLTVFGYISLAGLLLNVLVLPILSALYVVIFFSVIVSLVVPAAGVILPAACTPLQLFLNMCVSARFEDALLRGTGGWLLAVCVFAAIAALSDKFNLRRVARTATCCVCALVFALYALFGNGIYGNQCKIYVGGYYEGGMVLIRTAEGCVLVVTEDLYCSRVPEFVNRYATDGVTDLIIVGGEECLAFYNSSGIDAERLYLSQGNINLSLPSVQYVSDFSLYGADYSFHGSDTLLVQVNGVRFAICDAQSPDTGSVDALISRYPDLNGGASTAVYFDLEGGDYNVYTQGCLQFSANNGKLELTGIVPAR